MRPNGLARLFYINQQGYVMYNYFIKTSDRKVHKYPESMQWMDSETFVEFLKSVRSDKAKFIQSWRTKAKTKRK